jgi:Immunoglobulin-like domain of bacterial spore germination
VNQLTRLGDPPTGRVADAEPPRPTAGPRRRRTGVAIALGAALAVVALLAAALTSSEGGDDRTTTGAATAPEPSTGGSRSPVIAQPVDTSTAVFPWASSDLRFNDPVEAARAFAVDFAGFTEPVIGVFMQGDPRSGEVEVRSRPDGPVTTVLVRQLSGADTWWVLGAVTAEIVVEAPAAGASISSPVELRGSALAFEGTVNVEVRQDGTHQPLGTGFVTGAGDVAGPFSDELAFSTPTERFGAVVFREFSEEDGRVLKATVVRVAFAGGGIPRTL